MCIGEKRRILTMQKKYRIILLATLISRTLLAQDTVEDLTNLPVSDDLSPSVIDMPLLIEEDTVSSKGASLSSVQTKSRNIDSNQSTLETINGVIQKKVKKSENTTVIKFDKEVPEVKGLEPAADISL